MSGIANCRHKKGFAKIQYTCDEARENGIKYAWVDTCCIDKTSSAELSEAINSMFQWYKNAVVCYVYLADVSYWPVEMADMEALFGNEPSINNDESRHRSSSDDSSGMHTGPVKTHTDSIEFHASRWFSGGWTLQELIAPKRVRFYDRVWTLIGSKRRLVSALTEITTISQDVLVHRRHLRDCSVAKRMSWASVRQTTRIEDEAYCLLGDNLKYFHSGPDYLAQPPANFVGAGTYTPTARSGAAESYNITARGLEITTGLVYSTLEALPNSSVYAILDCFDAQRCTRRLAFELKSSNHPDPNLATESIMHQIVTVDVVLGDKIKIVRSITILTDNPEIPKGYDPSIDLRIRCILAYEWNSMLSSAGTRTGSEVVSLKIRRSQPAGAWDPRNCIYTIHKSDQAHLKDGTARGFIGKLCYTPRTLGGTRFEVFFVVHLYLNAINAMVASLQLLTEAISKEPAWEAIEKDSYYPNLLCAPQEIITAHNDCEVQGWKVRLLHIKPSTNDPIGPWVSQYAHRDLGND